jgi:hypothetical protein
MSTDREQQHADALLKSKQPNEGLADSASATDTAALDAQLDPNDEIPVPIAMEPGEIDERAQVVEALRGKGPPPRTDTQINP